jgi:predicted dehydrogenase
MLRIGVVGCGRVFERFHLPALERIPSLVISGVCDSDQERLDWITRHRPRLSASASVEDLLTRANAPRALLILTPPPSHAALAVRALNAGIHVLVEKPMALTVEEGRGMVDVARRAGCVLQVGFARRFRTPYRLLRERLERIDRAAIRSIDFELSFPTAGWNAVTTFLGDDLRGGGVFDDVVSHQVDLLCWLLRGKPDEVRGTISAGVSARASLRFGNLIAECRAAHGPYRERLIVELGAGEVLEATGSRFRRTGSTFSAFRRRRAQLLDRGALVVDRVLRRPNVSLSSFERQLRDFEQAVQGLPAMGATGDDALLALGIVGGCRESARHHGEWRPLERPVR